MAQLVEHILGKDEVPGPNPGSSSRRPRSNTSGLWFFIGFPLPYEGSTFYIYGVGWCYYSRFESGFCVANPVRIPLPKIGKLAWQA